MIKKHIGKKAVILLIIGLVLFGKWYIVKYNPVFIVNTALNELELYDINDENREKIIEFNLSGMKYGLSEVKYKNNAKIKSDKDNGNYTRAYMKIDNNRTQIIELEGSNYYKSKALVKVTVMFYTPYKRDNDFEGNITFTMERKYLKWKIIEVSKSDIHKVL